MSATTPPKRSLTHHLATLLLALAAVALANRTDAQNNVAEPQRYGQKAMAAYQAADYAGCAEAMEVALEGAR